MTYLRLAAWLWAALIIVGCGSPKPVAPKPRPVSSAKAEEAPPTGRLPADVRPLSYELELAIDPREKTFSGTVDIVVELERSREHIWLHGNGLTVKEASVTPTGGMPIAARYEQMTPGGVARLELEEAVGPSDARPSSARISMAFEGPFDERLNGLYRVDVEGRAYAFTQMEPVWTRKAFPCFDEPAFKTPFTISVVADSSDVVIANTQEVGRDDAGSGKVRIRFAKSEPLPTYLIAFAVGPLDVVEAPDITPNSARKRPLPFRGVAAKGRGTELAYALAHTPPILAELERYFGVAYPYDKLDIIAVPDKGGAMENAGAVTFREWLLLLDDQSPLRQKHAFAYVMAHELAHQWFGNLVTMPWWNDIWLNEAFATWMGHRAVHAIEPGYEADLRALRGVHGAMSVDSLMSARQIRQPVDNDDHIHAAFDRITYRKGGGVLAMIERWLGPDVFRKGMQRYMHKHAHASATAEDLMAVLGEAAGRDVKKPFESFLLQPGLPNIHADLDCSAAPKVTLSQSRYLPLGSKGDAAQTWQVPVCVRYGDAKKSHETCTLLTQRQSSVALDGTCPAWVMPNAGAAGYYQWSMPPAQVQALVDHGLRSLHTAEQMSLGRAVLDMMRAGKLDAVQAAAALKPLARIEHPDVVAAPMQLIRRLRRFLEGDPLRAKAEELGRTWFRHTYAKLGWSRRKGDGQRERLLRANIIGFLLHNGRDPELRAEALERARAYLGLGGDGAIAPQAIDPDLATTVLAAAGEKAEPAFFDAALAHLKKARDEQIRGNLIVALAHAQDPALAARSRSMVLKPLLKVSEAMGPIHVQMSRPETRAAAWKWVRENMGGLIERLPPRRAGWMPGTTASFCSLARAKEMKAFFEPLLPKLAGGRREIDKAHEAITLCAAGKAHQLPKIRELLGPAE